MRESVREVFETNFFGVIMVTNAMLPLLRSAPTARIVNLSSSVGSLTQMTDPAHYFARMLPGIVAYPSSKTALNMLTVQDAKALRSEGILVNAADPGACATDFSRQVAPTSPAPPPRAPPSSSTWPPWVRRVPTGGYFNEAGEVPW